jgi:hypothetical protein
MCKGELLTFSSLSFLKQWQILTVKNDKKPIKTGQSCSPHCKNVHPTPPFSQKTRSYKNEPKSQLTPPAELVYLSLALLMEHPKDCHNKPTKGKEILTNYLAHYMVLDNRNATKWHSTPATITH